MGKGYRDRLCRRCADTTNPLEDFDWIEDNIDELNGPDAEAFVEDERRRRIARLTTAQTAGQLQLFSAGGQDDGGGG